MNCDADVPPDPKAWLELDDTERIDLVIAYHRRFHLSLGGSAKLHGAVHAVVENQIAHGSATAVPATLTRTEIIVELQAHIGSQLCSGWPSFPRSKRRTS